MILNNPTHAISCDCGAPFSDVACCAPHHQTRGKTITTAEQLMRSRYSAFVKQDIAYIVETTLPAQQHLLNIAELKAWAETHDWQSLTILPLLANPQLKTHHGQVGFIATAYVNGTRVEHHELSTFVFSQGQWYFLDPTVAMQKIGRNDPCPCQNGFKFKTCCSPYLS